MNPASWVSLGTGGEFTQPRAHSFAQLCIVGHCAPATLSGGADAGPYAEQRDLRGDDCDGGGGAAHPSRSMTDPLCSCCYCTAVVENGEVKTKPSGFGPNSKVSVFSLEILTSFRKRLLSKSGISFE